MYYLFNRKTLQVFVTYLTGALYVHHLWFYKHQHENHVRSKLFVACQRWWFQWRFWFVPSVPVKMHNYCTPHIIKENFENFLIHRCNYILLSQVYCVWQVVKTPTIILNTPVYDLHIAWRWKEHWIVREDRVAPQGRFLVQNSLGKFSSKKDGNHCRQLRMNRV